MWKQETGDFSGRGVDKDSLVEEGIKRERMKVRRQERRGEGDETSALQLPPMISCQALTFLGCRLFSSPVFDVNAFFPCPCSILVSPGTPDAETGRRWRRYTKCLQLLAQRKYAISFTFAQTQNGESCPTFTFSSFSLDSSAD